MRKDIAASNVASCDQKQEAPVRTSTMRAAGHCSQVCIKGPSHPWQYAVRDFMETKSMLFQQCISSACLHITCANLTSAYVIGSAQVRRELRP